MKTRVFLCASKLMVIAATAITIVPRQSFAQTSWGTSVMVQEQDNKKSTNAGGLHDPNAYAQIQPGFGTGVSSAAADLIAGSIGLSATFTDADSTGTYGNIYETLHIGNAPGGAEGMLTLSANVSVTAVPLTAMGSDDYYVENDASATLLVNQGDSYLSSPFIGEAQMRVDAQTGTNISRNYYQTNGVDNVSLGTSTSLNESLTTTFALTANTDYFVELQAMADVNNTIFEGPFQSSGYYDGSNTYTASVDPPNWSFTTTPGVTYTTASGHPIGGVNIVAAPEASSVALLGFTALPIGVVVLRRTRRIKRKG